MFSPLIAARRLSRHRVLNPGRIVISLFMILIAFPFPLRAETGQIETLPFESTVRKELSGGQVHRYEIPMEAGQFLELRFKQENTNASINIISPGGEPVLSLKTPEVSFLAQSTGLYRLEIWAREKTTMTGRYEIYASRPQPANARDELQAKADLALSEGNALWLEERGASIRAAIEKFKTAAALYREAARPKGQAISLFMAGRASLAVENGNKQARELATQSLAVARPSHDRESEADALNILGIALYNGGDAQKALLNYEEAYGLFKALDNRRGQVTTLFNMANAYDSQGELRKSIDKHEEALKLAQSIGDQSQQAYIYNNLGLTLKSMGAIPKALDHFKKALALLDGSGNRRFEAKIHNNIGIAYKELGDYQKARDSYHRSLTISRGLDDKIAEPQLLNNIGNLFKAENENRKAIEYYEQALAFFRDQNVKGGEALVLNNLGSAYFQMGEYQKAIDHHLLSLEIRRARKDPRGEGSSLYHAGRVWQKMGQTDKAEDFFNRSLEIRRRLYDPIGEADSLLGLAGVRRDLGDLDGAKKQIEAALKLTEEMRSTLAGGDLRASYIARVQESYEFYIDLLMDLHRRSPSAGYDVQALVAAEHTRARVLLESLVEANADLRQGVDAETLKQEQALQKQLSAASLELSRLLASSSADAGVGAARARLESLSASYQLIQSQIRQNSPRYAALTQPKPLKPAEIQALLDENSVLLEFSLGSERSFLWAVTPTSIESFELPGRDRIGPLTGEVYAAWTARQPRSGESINLREQRIAAADANALEKASALSRMLLSPLAARLKNEWSEKRLLVVADGALEYMPFAALPAPDSTAALISQHEIVNLPSVSSLALLRRGAADRQPASKMIAVLADPVFEKNDPRYLTANGRKPANELISYRTRSAEAEPAVAPLSWASVRGEASDDSPNARRGLSRLPFSREEADAIVALAPASSRLKATDFHASLAAVMGGELENYRIVHFATHGLLDSDRPELSGLVLSLIDENGAPQNGFLRMADIYNLRLRAEMVVLSACQTGLGKEIKGEGLIGLTRGFMYAGAQRVVASLWQVDDMATAELMKRFYRGVLKDGARPAAAMRAAQLELMKQKRWSTPYYWAGFILQGEWK